MTPVCGQNCVGRLTHTDDSLGPSALTVVPLLSSNLAVLAEYSAKISIDGFVSVTSSLCNARSLDTSWEYLRSSYPGFSTHTPTLGVVRTGPPSPPPIGGFCAHTGRLGGTNRQVGRRGLA